MNFPNILTLLRIAFIPILGITMYLPFKWANTLSAMIFLSAALTDWLDGFLARRLSQTTPFGAFLDPVADKLMVTIVLTLLVEQFAHYWLTIPAVIIVGREIAISSLREWMAEIGKNSQVAVNIIGKIKTFTQMLAILLLLLSGVPLSNPIGYIGLFLLYLSALLTIWSMCIYMKAAWPDLNPFQKNKQKS